MEKYISEDEILHNIRKHQKSLSYDELFDIDMETKRMYMSDKGKENLNKQRSYAEYLANRYNRHKKKILT